MKILMSNVLCLMSYVLCPMSYVLCLMSYVLCLMSYVLCLSNSNSLEDRKYVRIKELRFTEIRLQMLLSGDFQETGKFCSEFCSDKQQFELQKFELDRVAFISQRHVH